MIEYIEKIEDLISDIESIADDVEDKAGYLSDAADCLREAIGELEKVGNVRVRGSRHFSDDLNAVIGEIRSLL